MKRMLCSARTNIKLNVPEIPSGIPSEKDPLADRIYQEDSGRGSDGSGVSNKDPGAHAQAIRQFPFTSHVAEDANEEVEHGER